MSKRKSCNNDCHLVDLQSAASRQRAAAAPAEILDINAAVQQLNLLEIKLAVCHCRLFDSNGVILCHDQKENLQESPSPPNGLEGTFSWENFALTLQISRQAENGMTVEIYPQIPMRCAALNVSCSQAGELTPASPVPDPAGGDPTGFRVVWPDERQVLHLLLQYGGAKGFLIFEKVKDADRNFRTFHSALRSAIAGERHAAVNNALQTIRMDQALLYQWLALLMTRPQAALARLHQQKDEAEWQLLPDETIELINSTDPDGNSFSCILARRIIADLAASPRASAPVGKLLLAASALVLEDFDRAETLLRDPAVSPQNSRLPAGFIKNRKILPLQNAALLIERLWRNTI